LLERVRPRNIADIASGLEQALAGCDLARGGETKSDNHEGVS
jgi:hypothetical protein